MTFSILSVHRLERHASSWGSGYISNALQLILSLLKVFDSPCYLVANPLHIRQHLKSGQRLYKGLHMHLHPVYLCMCQKESLNVSCS